jgi:hypothetical protein
VLKNQCGKTIDWPQKAFIRENHKIDLTFYFSAVITDRKQSLPQLESVPGIASYLMDGMPEEKATLTHS